MSRQRDLVIANVSAKAGSLSYRRLSVPNTFYPDGAPVEVPIILVNGKYEGPILYLDAATHGSEIAGVEVIQKVTRELINPQKLSGSIIAIPVVNIPSFRVCSGFNPHDFLDNNRGYPGDPEGSMNNKISYFVFEIAKKADYALNFHSLSQASVAMPFSHIHEVKNKEINKKMKTMAKAFGITYSKTKWLGKPSYTGFSAIAPCYGLPTILIELQSQYVCGRVEVEVGIRGALNVMKSLKMIKGKTEGQQGVPVIKEQNLTWEHATRKRAGFLRPIVEIGKEVKKGEEIAILVDVLGNKVDSITSPGNGYVIAFSGSFVQPIIKEGSWLAMIFVKRK